MLVDSTAATPARAAARVEHAAIVIELSGDWQLEDGSPRFTQVLDSSAGELDSSAGELEPAGAERKPPGAELDPPGAVRELGFEAGALGAWDSSLLIFLLQARDHCEAGGLRFDTGGLPDPVTRLLELARAVPDRAVVPDPAHASRVERLGAAGLSTWDAAMDAVTFTGQVTDSVIRLLLRRTRMRWREFWVVVQSNSSGALGIVTLIALLMGVIIAFLGVVVLKRFGAGYYVSYLVGYGMLREMGALMTGIIMAGRTGAAFAAELGSMKITEEIDAYTTLGVSPVDHLVMPRLLGLFVMMPLLVIYADVVGIAGGMMVAVTLLDLTSTQFIGGLLSAVTLSDALLGVFKASIFGVIIGLSGCMKGMQTGSDAGAVGRSATNAVVMGITLIILANAVVDWLAALLQI